MAEVDYGGGSPDHADAGNVLPTIGLPLLDCSSVASS